MPRPTRIQYPDAFYHVMNRGRGRQFIFHDEHYYTAFLTTVAEAHERFGVVVHAWCLLGNHYHLLVQTPHANLDRIMRHINGVYTQRYNRLKRTDGPLFRGRYKAILVDADAYLLQLSRYIHRNPVEMKRPLVERLEDYPWSSYPAYVGKAPCPAWLEQKQIYGQLGSRQKFHAMRTYVESGVDDETLSFYSRGNTRSIIGDKAFREDVRDKGKMSVRAEPGRVLQNVLTIDEIVSTVGEVFGEPAKSLLRVQRGRQGRNLARKVAMYMCQLYSDCRLREIAEAFGLAHPGGVSNAIAEVRRLVAAGKLGKELEVVKKRLNIIQLS